MNTPDTIVPNSPRADVLTPDAEYKFQAEVTYYYGLTIAQAQACMLVWTQANRIRAMVQGRPDPLFDVSLAEIKSVRIELTQLVIEVTDKKYRFDFDAATTTGGLIGGGISQAAGFTPGGATGLLSVYNAAKKSAAVKWMAAFRAANVPVVGSTDPNHLMKFTLKTLGIAFGILFALLILSFVVYMINE